MRAEWEDFLRVGRDSGWLWASTLAADRVLPLGLLRLYSPCVVEAEALRAQLEGILLRWGLSGGHSRIVAERMLYADLHGVDSHGTAMMPFYRQRLREGRLAVRPLIEVVRETEATALIDGGGGLGHVVGETAMRVAIEKCAASGISAVTVRNSWHFGAAGSYAMDAAEQGLLGIVASGTPTPSVVPTFGSQALLGTNPLAFAAPAERHAPFLLDMSTSTVSRGKLLARWRSGRRLPRGWALGRDGKTTRNGRVAARDRRLTPLGSDPERASHKGYGLAAMVEILSTVLPGVIAEQPRLDVEGKSVGHFFLALDPRRILPDGGFGGGLDLLIDQLRACDPVDPLQPVLVAGDPERAIREHRTVDGIPLTRSVFEDLRGVAQASGVEFRLESRRGR